MTYTVMLVQGYFRAEFDFKTGQEALKFMDIAMYHYLPYDEDGEPCEMKITMKIKGCAGSSNSEVAHTKDRLENSTD